MAGDVICGGGTQSRAQTQAQHTPKGALGRGVRITYLGDAQALRALGYQCWGETKEPLGSQTDDDQALCFSS